MKKNLPNRGKILSTAQILLCSLAVTTLRAQGQRKKDNLKIFFFSR